MEEKDTDVFVKVKHKFLNQGQVLVNINSNLYKKNSPLVESSVVDLGILN